MSQLELKLKINHIQKQKRINGMKSNIKNGFNGLVLKATNKLKDINNIFKLTTLIGSTTLSYFAFLNVGIALFGSLFTFAITYVILFNNNIPTKEELIKLK